LYCVHCGAELSDREEICSLCGKLSKVPDEKKDEPKADEPVQRSEAGEAGRPATDMPAATAETTAFCPVCKQYAYLDANGFCDHGHFVKGPGAAPGGPAEGIPPVPPGMYPGDIPIESFIGNTSGQGVAAVPPPQINGLNWGAFLLTWIWGVGNSVWISLLSFVPIVTYVIPFVLLFKGNEWAWRNKRWDSIDHFLAVQRKWTIVAITLYSIAFVSICVLVIFAMMAGSVSQTGSVSSP
jgi:hypothetical protein